MLHVRVDDRIKEEAAANLANYGHEPFGHWGISIGAAAWDSASPRLPRDVHRLTRGHGTADFCKNEAPQDFLGFAGLPGILKWGE